MNKFKFSAYLKELSDKMGRKPFTLFMDNLSCHHSDMAKAAYSKLKITPIFNAAYSHEMNPIELVFSKVKHLFKKEKLYRIMNKMKVD